MVNLTAALATGWVITDWRLYQAIEDFEAADHAWWLAVEAEFGADARNARYEPRGKGESGSAMRALHEARDVARLAHAAAWDRYRGDTVMILFADGRSRERAKPFPVDIDELPANGLPVPHARDIPLIEAFPGQENADEFTAAVAELMAGRPYRVGGGAAPLYEILRATG